MSTSLEQLVELLNSEQNSNYGSLDELKKILESEEDLLSKCLVFTFDFFSQNRADELKSRFVGKKSPLQDLLKSLKNIPAEERKGAGQLVNQTKQAMENAVTKFLKTYEEHLEQTKIASENEDITLPTCFAKLGSRHPISVVMRDLLVPFQRMGFAVVDGPEIDTEFFNFDALNVVKEHPAREMQDTFFLASEWVLRTHTSNVQSHAMKERGIPLKIVCPGCVYRNEFDMTHVPSFRQIECLVVDKGIHMGHLRHVINELLSAAFGRPVKIRLRSSFFPFTEPSAEVDVECQQCFGKGCRSCKHTGWSEIGGCGVVNRKVLENCGVDPAIYSGIAFGFGVDRIAKDRFAVADLRSLFDGNVEYLSSFSLT